MTKPYTATALYSPPSAAPVELTDEMLDIVSGGSNGIGTTMGPELAAAGGMPGMMAKMGATVGEPMGQMLHNFHGMKAMMTSTGMSSTG